MIPAATTSSCSECNGEGLVLIGPHLSICSSCTGKGYRLRPIHGEGRGETGDDFEAPRPAPAEVES